MDGCIPKWTYDWMNDSTNISHIEYSDLSLEDKIEPYLEGKKNVSLVPEFSKYQEFISLLWMTYNCTNIKSCLGVEFSPLKQNNNDSSTGLKRDWNFSRTWK